MSTALRRIVRAIAGFVDVDIALSVRSALIVWSDDRSFFLRRPDLNHLEAG